MDRPSQLQAQKGEHSYHHASTSDAGKMEKDPVCGMSVSSNSRFKSDYRGKTYRFCSESCENKFIASPERYLAAPAKIAAAPVQPGTIYTCPMHPEIRQDHPGNCPKCGMTLEPVIPELGEDENPELADFTRRFWWTLPLTAVVFILAMFGHRFGWVDASVQSWVELVLATPVVLWAGYPFFERCVSSFIHRSPNMWTLIGLGTGAAYVYSVIATVAPGIFPETFTAHGRIGVYFEAAAVIISLTLVGMASKRKEGQTSKSSTCIAGIVAATLR